MRFDKWAVTAQEALQSSVSIAADAEAGEVRPIHLLKALLQSNERNITAIIERVGADPAQVEAQVDQTIAHAPRVTGDMSQMSISNELRHVGDEAEKLASKLGDSYVTSEHLLCALADEKGDAGSALRGAGITGKRVQEAYEALSDRSRASLDDYLAFLAQRDEREAREREARERRRYDAVSYRLEQVFLAGLEEDDPDLFAFGTGERMRAAFEAYVNRRADELQEPDARASAKQIMAAYDRAHSTSRYDDMLVRNSQ